MAVLLLLLSEVAVNTFFVMVLGAVQEDGAGAGDGIGDGDGDEVRDEVEWKANGAAAGGYSWRVAEESGTVPPHSEQSHPLSLRRSHPHCVTVCSSSLTAEPMMELHPYLEWGSPSTWPAYRSQSHQRF